MTSLTVHGKGVWQRPALTAGCRMGLRRQSVLRCTWWEACSRRPDYLRDCPFPITYITSQLSGSHPPFSGALQSQLSPMDSLPRGMALITPVTIVFCSAEDGGAYATRCGRGIGLRQTLGRPVMRWPWYPYLARRLPIGLRISTIYAV